MTKEKYWFFALKLLKFAFCICPKAVSVLSEALVYDKLVGQCSVGRNIRDAACYLCWALARAYEPQAMSEHVETLAKGLLVVALTDREVWSRKTRRQYYVYIPKQII